MHVFVTGATGWIGAPLIRELLSAGHSVSALSRSADKAGLARQGAAIVQGSLADLDILRNAASEADAVVHTAYDHDSINMEQSAEIDRQSIEAMGDGVIASGGRLVLTSVLSGFPPGALVTEDDPVSPTSWRKSEMAAHAIAARGGQVATVRLPPCVHGVGESHGFIPALIRRARESGVSAYIGDGGNRWAGVHHLDAARLFRRLVEMEAPAGTYHAVADEGVPLKAIAKVIGQRLGLPVEPRDPDHFGGFAIKVGADIAASSRRTREGTGWTPTQADLLTDIDRDEYFATC